MPPITLNCQLINLQLARCKRQIKYLFQAGAGEAGEPVRCAEVESWGTCPLPLQLTSDNRAPSIPNTGGGSQGLLQGSGHLGLILVTVPIKHGKGQFGHLYGKYLCI